MDTLKPNEYKALLWLVERADAGDIDGEEFYCNWTNKGFLVADYPTEETPRGIKQITIERLARKGYLDVTQLKPSFFRCYIEDEAYDAVRPSKNQIKEVDMPHPLASDRSGKRVFISYTSKDKALVDALVDLLQTGAGISADDVFAFSLAGQGVPPNANFVDYIKKELQRCGAVLAVISPDYHKSAFCLRELGAAWVLSENLYPLVVPPLSFGDLDSILTASQATRIDDAAALSSFAQYLVTALGLPAFNVARWEVKRNQFIERVNALAISGASDDDKEESGLEVLPLGEDAERILVLLGKFDNREELQVNDFEAMLEMSAIHVKYHLDKLVELEYVYDSIAMGAETRYSLLEGGRAYLVEHGLI